MVRVAPFLTHDVHSDICAGRLLRTRLTFRNSVIVSVAVSKFGCKRAFVKRFTLCYRAVLCPVLSCPVLSYLSVCNVGVLWPNGWMDQDATWYGERPRPLCQMGTQLLLSKMGTAAPPPLFGPIVAKRSPISATAELLSFNLALLLIRTVDKSCCKQPAVLRLWHSRAFVPWNFPFTKSRVASQQSSPKCSGFAYLDTGYRNVYIKYYIRTWTSCGSELLIHALNASTVHSLVNGAVNQWRKKLIGYVIAEDDAFKQFLWYCLSEIPVAVQHNSGLLSQVLSSSWDRRPFGYNRHGPKIGGCAFWGSWIPM